MRLWKPHAPRTLNPRRCRNWPICRDGSSVGKKSTAGLSRNAGCATMVSSHQHREVLRNIRLKRCGRLVVLGLPPRAKLWSTVGRAVHRTPELVMQTQLLGLNIVFRALTSAATAHAPLGCRGRVRLVELSVLLASCRRLKWVCGRLCETSLPFARLPGARASAPAETILQLDTATSPNFTAPELSGRKKLLPRSIYLVGTAAKMAALQSTQRRRESVGRAVHCAPVWVVQTQPPGLESCRPRPYGRGYVYRLRR